eukprot:35417-Eustigmatos_ZCMA.PRE.1
MKKIWRFLSRVEKAAIRAIPPDDEDDLSDDEKICSICVDRIVKFEKGVSLEEKMRIMQWVSLILTKLEKANKPLNCPDTDKIKQLIKDIGEFKGCDCDDDYTALLTDYFFLTRKLF